jgi:hypothetical protein
MDQAQGIPPNRKKKERPQHYSSLIVLTAVGGERLGVGC